MAYQGTYQSLAFQAIEEKQRRNTRQVLEDAATKGILPREAAVYLAVQRLKKSMSYRTLVAVFLSTRLRIAKHNDSQTEVMQWYGDEENC